MAENWVRWKLNNPKARQALKKFHIKLDILGSHNPNFWYKNNPQ